MTSLFNFCASNLTADECTDRPIKPAVTTSVRSKRHPAHRRHTYVNVIAAVTPVVWYARLPFPSTGGLVVVGAAQKDHVRCISRFDHAAKRLSSTPSAAPPAPAHSACANSATGALLGECLVYSLVQLVRLAVQRRSRNTPGRRTPAGR